VLPMEATPIKISLTVGKLDAGIAILLTHDFRLIEFPSILLPKNIAAGSIVDIQVSRNSPSEDEEVATFKSFQSQILELYGTNEPSRPILRVRNATQTSVVLNWDPISTGSGDLRTLTLYKNNSRLGTIPNPQANTNTKLSGLSVDTSYTFHLVLKTSAGTFTSDRVVIKTHKMTELSGITVCAGPLSSDEESRMKGTVERIGAKEVQDSVQIDTTHFVCSAGQGEAWRKAVEMNIPVVRVDWLEACEAEGRIVGVRAYYLDAGPNARQQSKRSRGSLSSKSNSYKNDPTPSSTPSRMAPDAESNTSPSKEGDPTAQPMNNGLPRGTQNASNLPEREILPVSVSAPSDDEPRSAVATSEAGNSVSTETVMPQFRPDKSAAEIETPETPGDDVEHDNGRQEDGSFQDVQI